jgi:hypothetical protein
MGMSDTTCVCWSISRDQSVEALELGASHVRAWTCDVICMSIPRLVMSLNMPSVWTRLGV